MYQRSRHLSQTHNTLYVFHTGKGDLPVEKKILGQ